MDSGPKTKPRAERGPRWLKFIKLTKTYPRDHDFLRVSVKFVLSSLAPGAAVVRHS